MKTNTQLVLSPYQFKLGSKLQWEMGLGLRPWESYLTLLDVLVFKSMTNIFPFLVLPLSFLFFFGFFIIALSRHPPLQLLLPPSSSPYCCTQATQDRGSKRIRPELLKKALGFSWTSGKIFEPIGQGWIHCSL